MPEALYDQFSSGSPRCPDQSPAGHPRRAHANSLLSAEGRASGKNCPDCGRTDSVPRRLSSGVPRGVCK